MEVIQMDGSDKRFWDFRELFNTRSARYRTFLVTCIAWFGELDLPPTSYYFPLMAKTAGITSVQTQLLLNALQTPIMMVAALCGLRFVEKLGRRKVLMASSTGMSASVAVITACTARQAGHPAVGATGVAFLYVFLVVFAFAWVSGSVNILRSWIPLLTEGNKKDTDAVIVSVGSSGILNSCEGIGLSQLHEQRGQGAQHLCPSGSHRRQWL